MNSFFALLLSLSSSASVILLAPIFPSSWPLFPILQASCFSSSMPSPPIRWYLITCFTSIEGHFKGNCDNELSSPEAYKKVWRLVQMGPFYTCEKWSVPFLFWQLKDSWHKHSPPSPKWWCGECGKCLVAGGQSGGPAHPERVRSQAGLEFMISGSQPPCQECSLLPTCQLSILHTLLRKKSDALMGNHWRFHN